MCLAEPVKRAAIDAEERATAREGGGPAGIDEGDERSSRGRAVIETAVFGAVEVDEDADGSIEGFESGIGEEA